LGVIRSIGSVILPVAANNTYCLKFLSTLFFADNLPLFKVVEMKAMILFLETGKMEVSPTTWTLAGQGHFVGFAAATATTFRDA
jgi:hypothetical protein